MTATEKIARAEHWRIGHAKGWNGVFAVPVDGELWQVILSDRDGWRQLAATNLRYQGNQAISANVTRTLRDYFFGDEAWVVQYWPPADAWQPRALQLWESIDQEMPVPVEKQASFSEGGGGVKIF